MPTTRRQFVQMSAMAAGAAGLGFARRVEGAPGPVRPPRQPEEVEGARQVKGPDGAGGDDDVIDAEYVDVDAEDSK